MKNNILAVTVLACLLLVCMAGCKANAPVQPEQPGETGASMTVVGNQNGESALTEGSFVKPAEMDQLGSNAKELGGSQTLEIEFPEEETQPDQGDTEATEPQWQPGIW